MTNPPPETTAAAIRERLKKITPGPWAWESIAEKSNEFAVGTAFDANGTQLSGRLPEGEWVEDAVIERRSVVGMNESGHAHFADADFIAHAPTDIAYLLDLLDAQARQQAEQATENAHLRDLLASERADAHESHWKVRHDLVQAAGARMAERDALLEALMQVQRCLQDPDEQRGLLKAERVIAAALAATSEPPRQRTSQQYQCDHCRGIWLVEADEHHPRGCTLTNCNGTQSPVTTRDHMLAAPPATGEQP